MLIPLALAFSPSPPLGADRAHILLSLDHVGDVAAFDVLLEDQFLIEIDRVAFRNPDVALPQILIRIVLGLDLVAELVIAHLFVVDRFDHVEMAPMMAKVGIAALPMPQEADRRHTFCLRSQTFSRFTTIHAISQSAKKAPSCGEKEEKIPSEECSYSS
jgi:hypothetical protein